MILIKNKNLYSIENITPYIKLEGRVFIDSGELEVNTTVYSLEGQHLGFATYIYRGPEHCCKSLGEIPRNVILYVEQALEDTVSFLILELKLS